MTTEQRQVTCKECSGTGKCSECHGQSPRTPAQPGFCDRCDGWRSCIACSGNGAVINHVWLDAVASEHRQEANHGPVQWTLDDRGEVGRVVCAECELTLWQIEEPA